MIMHKQSISHPQLAWLGLLILWLSSCGGQATSTPEVEPTQISPTEATTSALPAGVDSETNVFLLRGNPQRTGVYDVSAIRQPPEIEWQVKAGYSLLISPMIADGLLYTISTSGTMYALNVQTGQEVWSVEGLGQHENVGAIVGDKIISAGISRQVRAHDRHNGVELWTFETGYPVQGAPLVVADRVFIATYGEIYALNLQSGEPVWNVETGNTEDAYVGAPAYEDGVIYAGGGKTLFALDSQTGQEVWRVEKEEMFLGLAVANDTVYAGNWDRTFYAYNRLTGEELWTFQGQNEIWSFPAVMGTTVYAGNQTEVYAFDAKTGEVLWTFAADGPFVSEPLIADGVLYFSDGNHQVRRAPLHLYALDANTGNLL